jgi:16S rRNA processing protein RimM
MGRISAPFGIKGWVKVEPYTAEPRNLLAYPTWWVGSEKGWRSVQVERGEVHGPSVVVKLPGCEDRDAAALYRGLEVAVPRDALPPAGKDEYYWADLVGCRVVNLQDEEYGAVTRLFETGANDVMVVEGDGGSDSAGSADARERERLIPFIADVVREVDVAGRVIRVDWAPDY